MILRNLLLCFAGLTLAASVAAEEFDIKQDGVTVAALAYGSGDHVVLALPGARPGTQPNRNALKKFSAEIAEKGAGIKIVSISWSDAGSLAAAVRNARENGAAKVSLLGHSRGAEMIRQYASAQPEGEFNSLILLSSGDDQGIPLEKTKKLFVYNKGDAYARPTAASFEKSAEPKQMLALDGDGHLVDHLKAERPSLIDDIVEMLKL